MFAVSALWFLYRTITESALTCLMRLLRPLAVVGEPLRLPCIKEPSREDVAKWHAAYVDHLRAHFDKHKKTYAHNPDAQLEVVGPTDFGLKA